VDSALAPAASSPSTSETAVRLAVVGVSLNATCGVRDHAALLAAQLEREGVGCSLHWLRREQRSLAASHAEIGGWTRGLAAELAAERPDAILLHYSVFSYSHRGLPVFVPAALAPLRRARVPVLAFMHELAYPFGPGGPRGVLWASSQRVALRPLMALCAGAIVTADFRASWLCSRRWLPRRRVLLAPVFATIPPPSRPARSRGLPAADGGPLLGIFGYSYESAARTLVLDALRELRERGVAARLTLLGAPGAASAAGEAWSAAARERGVAEQLSFSGSLPAQELSDALAGCDALVFADASGPSSRKTTLAASLASGAPLVAIDGPRAWRALAREHAAEVVRPTPAALADALADLLGDRAERAALGARGRAFAEREMSLAASAGAVRALLDEALSPRHG
jgi:glycosyltransferase involved in cell wall biosynthesis